MGDDGFKRLRAPFPDHQVSKLPKATISGDKWRALPKAACAECGGYHPATNTIHLSYVGHAALTDRLLDVDPTWTWEPLAFTEQGLPRFDDTGGLWIKLTVLGHTRLGYGHAERKQYMEAGAREKEVIGDALRNAAMRFGCALELWHKGDLHISDAPETQGEPSLVIQDQASKLDPPETQDEPILITQEQAAKLVEMIEAAGVDKDRFLRWLRISSLAELPAAHYAVAERELLKKMEAARG